MMDKFGHIKNPLTIIAIFAGIAEVSGTTVVSFLTEDNQKVFVWFLILFPLILVVAFFITLNINHKVLYAPSDFQNEDNFFRISKYDAAIQEDVTVKYLKEESIQILANQNKQMFLDMSAEIQKVEKLILKKETKTNLIETKNDIFSYQVIKFRNVNAFLKNMNELGYEFSTYASPHTKDSWSGYDTQESIWLGYNITLEIAKEVILAAKRAYPHLKYIHINKKPRPNSIFIGGSTETAENRYKCAPLLEEDFQHIKSIKTQVELHEFIESFYPKKDEEVASE